MVPAPRDSQADFSGKRRGLVVLALVLFAGIAIGYLMKGDAPTSVGAESEAAATPEASPPEPLPEPGVVPARAGAREERSKGGPGG